MSQPFDPYHKWLAIPPKDQPPNHYRLLGIEAYEADEDVIANAADQRMAHLKSFQSGRYAARSQEVLNEVAAARACLLDPLAKQRYDADLQGAPQSGQVTGPEGAFVASLPPLRRATGSKQSRATRRRTQKFSVFGHVILPLVVIFFGYVILCFIKPEYSPFGSTDEKNNPIENVPEIDGVDDGHKGHLPTSAALAKDKNGKVNKPNDLTGGATDGSGDAPVDSGPDGEPPSTERTTNRTNAPPGNPDGRPSTAERPSRQSQLAKLESVRDQALANGNIVWALNIIAKIASLNGGDSLQQQISALGPIAEAAQTSHEHQMVALASLMLTNRAIEQDRLPAARRLAVMALDNARRTPNQALVNRVSLRLDEIKRLSASD